MSCHIDFPTHPNIRMEGRNIPTIFKSLQLTASLTIIPCKNSTVTKFSHYFYSSGVS